MFTTGWSIIRITTSFYTKAASKGFFRDTYGIQYPMLFDQQVQWADVYGVTNYPTIGFRIVRPVEPDELTGITSKVVKENDEEFKP